MPRTKRNELTAGLFVLACIAVLIAVIVWVGGVRFGGRFVYLTAPLGVGDVSIVQDSKVKLSTTVVGKVDRVIPAPDWRMFTFRIRLTEPVDIRSDALIQASAPTLGGVGSLTVLDLGSPLSPPADRDHPVALIVGPNAMVRDLRRELGYGDAEQTAVQGAIADIRVAVQNMVDITTALKLQLTDAGDRNMLSEATGTLKAMNEAMSMLRDEVVKFRTQLDPANPTGAMAKLLSTLDHTNEATGQAAAMMTAIRPDLQEAASGVAKAAERIEHYAESDLSQLLQSLRAGGDDLLVLMSDFRTMASTARDVVAVNNENINEMVANLTQVSVNLKAASREIRRHPWKLMGEPSVSDVRTQNIQNAVEAFAEGATQLDDAINRLKTLSAAADGPVKIDDPQLEAIRRKIGDSFENFHRVEQALWAEIAK